MGSETQHISQCRTSIGGSECVSGLGVTPFRRLERLEALLSDIPLFDAGQRSLRARPVRESSERPVNPVLQLEAGSNGPSNRRPLAELGSRETIRISPFCLIMRCLAKLREEGGELILVTPVWPTQAWYPSLLELSVSLPILLPWGPKLLQGPQGQSHPLVMNQTLQLAAWHVCNDLCSQRAFLSTLPSSSWRLGGQVQTQFIIPHGKNGIAGVSQGKLILFAPLWQI